MNFVFYDTETTGTNTTFDQILQFAAILTNENLEEIDRWGIRCRLLPHIVPAPMALLVTGVRPSQLTDPSLPSHYRAMRSIAAKMEAWSPAVFTGYNSLAFDEVLLRQAFYQTLQPLYLTNMSGNTRADVFRLVQAATVYSPNSIAVPISEKGRETRKLDTIAPANGFTHENAHEAMADVEATIFMARLVRDRTPEIWREMMNLVSKSRVQELVHSRTVLSHTEFYYGKPYSWPVTGCGQDPGYNARLGIFDLQNDPAPYLEMSVEDLVDVLNGSPKVIRSIKANAQPILLPVGLAGEELHPVDLDVARDRANTIAGAHDFRKHVGEALSQRFEPPEPSPYVEGRIYDGFYNNADNALARKFHEAPWPERHDLLLQAGDDRMRELGTRLIYLEHPEVLPPEIRGNLDQWCRSRLISDDPDVRKLGIDGAISATDEILAEAGETDLAPTSEIRSWLASMKKDLRV